MAFCEKCGAELTEGSKFCTKCGNESSSAGNTTGTSDKSWLAAFFLCWFFGLLGVHRFYTGHTIAGVIQLLTLGGFGIWSTIDWFIILFGGFKDKAGNPIKAKKGQGKIVGFSIAGLFVLFIILVAVSPDTEDSSSASAAGAVGITGKIIDFGCGDNCYLDVLSAQGDTISVLVPFEGFQDMIDNGQSYIGKQIQVAFSTERFFHPGAGEEIEREILTQYTMDGKTVVAPKPKATQQSQQQEAEEPAPVEKPVSDMTYWQLKSKLEKLTDLQWEEYAKTVVGTRVKWKARLEEVAEGGVFTTKYIAKFDPNQIDYDLVQMGMDVDDSRYPCIEFEVSKDQALKLEKGKWLTFVGDITEARASFVFDDDVLVVKLANAKIVN